MEKFLREGVAIPERDRVVGFEQMLEGAACFRTGTRQTINNARTLYNLPLLCRRLCLPSWLWRLRPSLR